MTPATPAGRKRFLRLLIARERAVNKQICKTEAGKSRNDLFRYQIALLQQIHFLTTAAG